MATRSCLASLLALALGPLAPAAEPPGPDQARQAARRALPVLLEGGAGSPKDQVKGRGCMSCHWNGTAVFSLSLSRRDGLVDRQELGRFDTLLKKQSTKMLAYQFGAGATQLVERAGVPADKQADLKKLNGKTFTSLPELKRELGKLLPADAVEKNLDEIAAKTANPNHYDTVARLMSAWLLISGAAANTPAPADVSKGLVEQLLGLQDKDGCFFESGQPYFPCDPKEQRECYTIWALLALQAVEPKSAAITTAIDRGLAYLKKTKPGQSVTALALRTLLAHRFRDAGSAAEFAAALVKRQQADGGWSIWDWKKESYESDAWATGLALYTLGTLGRDHSDGAVRRAWAFLIASQGDDGEWTVTNANGKAARIWSMWGTGWAVNGLLATTSKR